MRTTRILLALFVGLAFALPAATSFAATLAELQGISRDGALLNRIEAAVAIVAEEIRVDASPPANQAARLAWAKEAFINPDKKALEMIWAMLAANESLPTAQILGASDAGVLSAVRAAVDVFADN